MCALAQILLDPYFRTIEGIATLVEKEWCAFGHKFQDRCGHGQDFNHLPDERSPVFLQFLDALYQVVAQFPTAFEYTDGLLLFLADHVSSCLFGNFLGICCVKPL
jgi:myotubularin-related protein 1/2